MKRIEDIEIMEPEELESAALEENAPVPSGLENHILASIAAKAILEEKTKQAKYGWGPYALLAVAASIAAVAIITRSSANKLTDTFDDPYIAYAKVEETFQIISDKMATGVHLAAKAGETADKAVEIINKISE